MSEPPTRTRDVSFDAPLVSPALEALEDGRMPDERTLRGAIRELRSVLRFVERKGAPGQNLGLVKWLEDHIDVLRWALRQPTEQYPARLCFRCNRRDRHFGELCKRCAEVLAARPRGKVI